MRGPWCGARPQAIAPCSRKLRDRLRLEEALRAEHARKDAADAELARDLELRLMELQHVLDDRKAKAGAAGLARAARRDAVETLGQPRQVLCRNALAGVGYRKTPAECVGFPAERDAPARWRVAHRVTDKVGERAVQILDRAADVL